VWAPLLVSMEIPSKLWNFHGNSMEFPWKFPHVGCPSERTGSAAQKH
jgi:hypothetical protein